MQGLYVLSDSGKEATVGDKNLVRLVGKVQISSTKLEAVLNLSRPLTGRLLYLTKDVQGTYDPIGSPTGTDVTVSESTDRTKVTVKFITSTQSPKPAQPFTVMLGEY